MNLPLDQAVEKLQKRFVLSAVWVFGSAAHQQLRIDSDVDLAMLVQSKSTFEEWVDARTELAQLFQRDVDLVDLERASPILQMQVLRTGRLLFGGESTSSGSV